jgi:hypothetical protein
MQKRYPDSELATHSCARTLARARARGRSGAAGLTRQTRRKLKRRQAYDDRTPPIFWRVRVNYRQQSTTHTLCRTSGPPTGQGVGQGQGQRAEPVRWTVDFDWFYRRGVYTLYA